MTNVYNIGQLVSSSISWEFILMPQIKLSLLWKNAQYC